MRGEGEGEERRLRGRGGGGVLSSLCVLMERKKRYSPPVLALLSESAAEGRWLIKQCTTWQGGQRGVRQQSVHQPELSRWFHPAMQNNPHWVHGSHRTRVSLDIGSNSPSICGDSITGQCLLQDRTLARALDCSAYCVSLRQSPPRKRTILCAR